MFELLLRTGVMRINAQISDIVFDDSVAGLYHENRFASLVGLFHAKQPNNFYYDYIVALKLHFFS